MEERTQMVVEYKDQDGRTSVHRDGGWVRLLSARQAHWLAEDYRRGTARLVRVRAYHASDGPAA